MFNRKQQHMLKRAEYDDPEFPSGLYFRKSGKDIIDQVNKEIGKLEKVVGFVAQKGGEICTKYKLSWDDVVAEERNRRREEQIAIQLYPGPRAGRGEDGIPDTQYAVSTMESMELELESSKMPLKDRQESLRQVQRDLASISTHVQTLFRIEERRQEFRRVTNNLSSSDVFIFDFDELRELGFE